MRTICDVCEGAPAILFCAADEAALCASCDDKVHKCNKLASRHARVGLADPSEVPRCDICENAPAFFYCEIDGSSLCLQCDMIVHVGGKRTHGRYLLLRQKVEFPGDKSSNLEDGAVQCNRTGNREQNHINRTAAEARTQSNMMSVAASERKTDNNVGADADMIDLNARPRRTHDPAPNPEVHRPDTGNNR